MSSITDLEIEIYLDLDRRAEFRQLIQENQVVSGFEFKSDAGMAV